MPSNRKKRIRARQSKTHESWQTAARHVDTVLPEIPPPFVLDSTALPSDWDDVNALWADMESFAAQHPSHVFLNADDPGFSGAHRARAPRVGWTAYRPHPEDEQARYWTITIPALKASLSPEHPLRSFLQTAMGRAWMIPFVIESKSVREFVTVPLRSNDGRPFTERVRSAVEEALHRARHGLPAREPARKTFLWIVFQRADGSMWGMDTDVKISAEQLLTDIDVEDRWGVFERAVGLHRAHVLHAGAEIDDATLAQIRIEIPLRRIAAPMV